MWHLQTHTVPDYLRKCYLNVDLDTVKKELGAGTMSASNFNNLLKQSDLLEDTKPDSKGFVTIKKGPSSSALADSSSVNFELTPERVLKLTQVVQFLEKQNHDVEETARKLLTDGN